MQLTSVVTPFTDDNLQLLAQIGVTHVTIRYPGKERDQLEKNQNSKSNRVGCRLLPSKVFFPSKTSSSEMSASMKRSRR